MNHGVPGIIGNGIQCTELCSVAPERRAGNARAQPTIAFEYATFFYLYSECYTDSPNLSVKALPAGLKPFRHSASSFHSAVDKLDAA